MSIPNAHRFATAIQPEIAETTLFTSSDGLDERWVDVAVEGGTLPVYAASPANAAGPLPVVLVVQEIFGVHEHIKDVARRFAKLGYLALAPELYFRLGDSRLAPTIEALRTDFVSKVSDATVLSDLDATVGWGEANGGDPDRLALAGFCWGGRIAWLYAAHQPKLKAAAAWYGRLIGPVSDLAPRNPVDLGPHLLAPVLGLYGGADAGIPQQDVNQLENVLHAIRSSSRVVVYPGAPHAFFADYRPSFRREAAEDAWDRQLRWFVQHGV